MNGSSTGVRIASEDIRRDSPLAHSVVHAMELSGLFLVDVCS
jgi:hypothetical protein